jgi:hypothetical protein
LVLGNKKCVACAEKIRVEATLCRFCRTAQPANPTKRTAVIDLVERGTRPPLLTELRRTSWVLLAGFVPHIIFGTRFDSIYGPTQPVGVFSSGVFLAASASALSLSVFKLFSDTRRAAFDETWRYEYPPRGYWVWALISLVISIAAFLIGMEYNRNH